MYVVAIYVSSECVFYTDMKLADVWKLVDVCINQLFRVMFIQTTHTSNLEFSKMQQTFAQHLNSFKFQTIGEQSEDEKMISEICIRVCKSVHIHKLKMYNMYAY